MRNAAKILPACLAAALLMGAAAKPAPVPTAAHRASAKKAVAAKLAPPAPPPDGWDIYKFGMTPEQVQNIPALRWGDVKKNTIFNIVVYRLDAGGVTTLDGRTYKPAVFFDEKRKLDGIALMAVEKASAPQCEASLQQLLRTYQKQYGDFTPKAAKGTKGATQIDWRNLPSTHSQYSVINSARTPDAPKFESQHEFHDAADTAVDLSAAMDRDSCDLEIRFVQG